MQIALSLDHRSKAQLISNLRQILNNARVEAGQALYDFARDVIMMESAVECPRKTWTLVNSGYVKKPEYSIDRVSVELGYGGPEDKMNPISHKMASEYMMIVHEDLYPKPVVHAEGTKAKFFEDPVRRNEQLLVEHLGSRVRMAMNIKPGG